MDNGIIEEEEGSFTNQSWVGSEEEEHDSLLKEAAGQNALLSRQALRFRSKSSKQSTQQTDSTTARILGILREGVGGRFTLHSVALVAALAIGLLLPLVVFDFDLRHESFAEFTDKSPHKPSLGGGLNPGHGNSTQSFNHTEQEEFPKSNVGFAVVSTTHTNRVNHNGHFWHDPYKSPYASTIYRSNAENASAAQAEQERFDTSRLSVMQEFGFYHEPSFGNLTYPDFDNAPYRDKPVENFTSNSWQANQAYVTQWLEQAMGLVTRVKEGIYREYGLDSNSSDLTEFGIILEDYIVIDGVAYDVNNPHKKLPGIAYLTHNAWNGLIRKLLHAMMTHDDFYAVVVGPASTYRGHNWFETQIMQFNYIMEPVFDKLGVRLISRNMGMNASTTISALGGADIYGEADILWYVRDPRPGVEPEHRGQFDLLHKQAIMSGEHLPLILTPHQGHLQKDTKGKAWVGNLQAGNNICGLTTMQQNGNVHVPRVEACRYMRCSEEVKDAGYCTKLRFKCWIERNDVNPSDIITPQNGDAGFEEGLSNHQEHRWEGRKLAMLVLHALDEALQQWSKQTKEGNLPLPASMWHVKEVYEETRETVRTLEHEPGQLGSSPVLCEELLKDVDPMICHMAMHAYTEWTPRVNPLFRRIKNITQDGIPDYSGELEELYTNIDLRPKEWAVPDGFVDVHMIAIATNSSVNVNKTIEGTETGGGDGNRRERALNWANSEQDMSSSKRPSSRFLDTDVATGTWKFHGVPIGFCDGSAQSRCNRAVGNSCLMANHNHYKAGVLGNSESGWLNMTLQKYREGVILVRFDWDYRSLKSLPSDFLFEYVIQGASYYMKRGEFLKKGVKIVDDLVLHPLIIEKEMSQNPHEYKDTVRVDLRISSSRPANETEVLLTHVYYA